MLKIGVIIPDKNDRPGFLAHCLDMMERQSIQPDHICLVNENSGIDGCDITWRYKKGFERIFNQYDCDVCFMIENDDWYRNDYIEQMLKKWEQLSRPDLLGIGTSVYYHIGLKKYKQLIHPVRSSAFCSMVTSEVLKHEFCADTEAFFDVYLWKSKMKKAAFIPSEQICLGIKHGIGSCGGKGHLLSFPYDKDDKDFVYLNSVIDKKSFNFYEGKQI